MPSDVDRGVPGGVHMVSKPSCCCSINGFKCDSLLLLDADVSNTGGEGNDADAPPDEPKLKLKGRLVLFFFAEPSEVPLKRNRFGGDGGGLPVTLS